MTECKYKIGVVYKTRRGDDVELFAITSLGMVGFWRDAVGMDVATWRLDGRFHVFGAVGLGGDSDFDLIPPPEPVKGRWAIVLNDGDFDAVAYSSRDDATDNARQCYQPPKGIVFIPDSSIEPLP